MMSACPSKFVSAGDEAEFRGVGALPASSASSAMSDQGRSVVLRDGELFVARSHRSGAVQLWCVSGHIWVTQEGRAEDIVVEAGETCLIPREGKIVAQALEEAVIRVALRGDEPVQSPHRG